MCRSASASSTLIDGPRPLPIGSATTPASAGSAGSGSKRRLPSGAWQLSTTAESYGRRKRVHRTVEADTAREAEQLLISFVSEVADGTGFVAPESRELTLDDAVHTFLFEHLQENKGGKAKTVNDYWRLYMKWFSPDLGQRPFRSLTVTDLDRAFGRMRKAGRTNSRLNHGRSLLGVARSSAAPTFRHPEPRLPQRYQAAYRANRAGACAKAEPARLPDPCASAHAGLFAEPGACHGRVDLPVGRHRDACRRAS